MTGHHSVIRREWVFDGYWLDKVKNGAKGIATGPASMKVEEEALLLADPSEITLVPGEEIIFYYQPMSIERGRARITAPSAHAATLDMNPHTTPAGFTGHVVSNTTMSPSYTCPLPVIYWHNSNNPSWAVKLVVSPV